MAREQFKRLVNTSSRNAFWEGWLEKSGSGYEFHFRWGKLGSNGQHRTKHFHSKWSAQSALNDKIYEKMSGDYYDATPAPAPAPSSPPKVAPIPAPKVVALPKPVEPEPEPEVEVDGFDFFDAIMVG
jgi:predicted DNA-binding WGR domain protein